MRKMIDELHGAGVSAAALSAVLSTLREELIIIEAEIQLETIALRGEDGKLVHTNETARGAAIALALAEDERRQRLAAEIRAREAEGRMIEAERERLRNLIRLERLEIEERIAVTREAAA